MLKRLKVKLVVIILVITTTMLCLIFGLLYHFTQAGLERESIDMMRSIASVPLRREQQGGPMEQRRLPCLVLQLNPRGELTAAEGGYYDLSDLEFLTALLSACEALEGQAGTLEDFGLRWYRMDTPEGRRLVFTDVTGERTVLRNLAKSFAVIGAVCFAVFLCASVLLAGWMVKPVERAWNQQRQFVADASHELKTPLTVIMTNAELLQGKDWDEDDKVKFSASILTMSRQMRCLVERLLELARSDSGQGAAAFESVDLSAVVENALLPFEPLFFEKGLELASQIEPGITVWGSPEQLGQAADILLDNAQKYSAAGGRVEAQLRRVGKRRCRLCVSSPGNTLSKAECQDIFKRFYRADKARSRDGSFGLGLSIAQSIAERHSGRIWAEGSHGVNTFYIELPTKGPS